MKLSTRFVSAATVALVALSAGLPVLASESQDSGRPTRREVRGDRDQNAPEVGNADVQERSTAVLDDTGRNLLPVRAAVRFDNLRNANRHRLGVARGGDYRILDIASDRSLSPIPLNEIRADRLAKAQELPPALVTTGGTTAEENDRPTRRDLRGSRNLNFINRR